MAAGWVYPFIPKTDMLKENNSSLTDSRHSHRYTHTYHWPCKDTPERPGDIYLMFYLVKVSFFSNGGGIEQQ